MMALGILPTLLLMQAGGATHLVVISGASGEPEYAAQFHEWSTTLVQAATGRMQVDPSNIVYLAEQPARDPTVITGASRKEAIEGAFQTLASKVQSNDIVFIVLIGHGSMRQEVPMFNIPGPDLSAPDFSILLDGFGTQRIVFVNLTTASGEFVAPLSKTNRTIITATKTGFERNASVFGSFFVQAFAEEGADVDKDQRVSVLEAFNFAKQEVERAYEADGRLQTEHALLDDNGDGVGSTEPGPTVGDGALARTIFLGGGGRVVVGDPDDAVLAQLLRERSDIEARIERLQLRKDSLPATEFDTQFEALAIELALKNREIRARQETN